MLALNKLAVETFEKMLKRVRPGPNAPAAGVPAGPGPTPNKRQQEEIKVKAMSTAAIPAGPKIQALGKVILSATICRRPDLIEIKVHKCIFHNA